MLSGFINFTDSVLKSSTNIYVDLPFSIPTGLDAPKSYYPAIINVNNGTTIIRSNSVRLYVYSTYLRFAAYQASWGSNTYAANIICPGTILRYFD